MTTRIYDPNNVPFDVTEARASDLVLNKGWTRQPTTTVPVEDAPSEPIVEDDWRLSAFEQDMQNVEPDAGDDEDAPAEDAEEEGLSSPPPHRNRLRKK